MMVIFILALFLPLYASMKVQANFSKYSKVANSKNITGAQAARVILDRNGLQDVDIEGIRGQLTDHYSPNEKILRLSEPVLQANTISAIAVAAHEVGHAIQDKESYSPMRMRSFLVPLAHIGSRLSYIFIIGGLFTQITRLFDIGIFAFSLAVLFYIITLPVEINASSRALDQLSSNGLVTNEERGAAKKVLSAAALTYIASALTAVFQLLRLLSLRSRD